MNEDLVTAAIKLDVRDSKPDWTPYELKQRPKGAPNVLIVLYDDTGLAAWSPFGGRINMPTLQKLADNGLTYSQWHTTALCSPTRSTFLTGRNHHVNRCASITEGSRRISRARRAACPPSARRSGRCCRTTATARSGSARITTCRPKTSRAAAAGRSGRCRRASTASTGSSAARPTTGIPTSSRTTSFIEQPYTPGRGLPPVEGPRRPGAQDAARPEVGESIEAVVHVVLPRRQPRAAPHPEGVRRQVQGQVRRRLRGVPRVGARADDREGHHAEGHAADADQSAARGRRQTAPATRCARGTR